MINVARLETAHHAGDRDDGTYRDISLSRLYMYIRSSESERLTKELTDAITRTQGRDRPCREHGSITLGLESGF